MKVAGSADQIDAPKGTRNCSTNERENRPRRRNSPIDSSSSSSITGSGPGSRSAPCHRGSSATSRRAARLKRTMSASRRRNDGSDEVAALGEQRVEVRAPVLEPGARRRVTLKLISVGWVATPSSRRSATKPG